MSLWTSLSQGLDVLGKTKWSHSLRAMRQKKVEFALWFKNSKLQPLNGQCPPRMETKHPLASCVDRSDGHFSFQYWTNSQISPVHLIFLSLWKIRSRSQKENYTRISWLFFPKLIFYRSKSKLPCEQRFVSCMAFNVYAVLRVASLLVGLFTPWETVRKQTNYATDKPR